MIGIEYIVDATVKVWNVLNFIGKAILHPLHDSRRNLSPPSPITSITVLKPKLSAKLENRIYTEPLKAKIRSSTACASGRAPCTSFCATPR